MESLSRGLINLSHSPNHKARLINKQKAFNHHKNSKPFALLPLDTNIELGGLALAHCRLTKPPILAVLKAPIIMNQKSCIRFNRPEYRWDTAESPASFVLRYVCNLRRFISEGLGNKDYSNAILQTIIQRLVNEGYQQTTSPRLRDYLILSIKNQTLSHCSALNESEAFQWIESELHANATAWLRCWRDGLLERAWRSLERLEHTNPNSPIYSVFHASSAKPSAALSMLGVEVATTAGLKLNESEIRTLLNEARIRFAQLLADEISETISECSRDSVLEEIRILGLNRAFENLDRTS